MSIWVIGGTSGIGAAIAKQAMTESGELVFVSGEEIDVTSIEKLENYCVDISDATTGEIVDPLTKVYYCAGVTHLEWLGKMDRFGQKVQKRVIDVNLMGFINVMDLLVRLWSENYFTAYDQGFQREPITVCAISSDASERPMRTSIGYCASKAGLNMAIRCAARELGPQGWRIFGVAPGMIQSTSEYPSKMTDYVDHRVPQVRGWSPEEAYSYEMSQSVVRNPERIRPQSVADLAVHLASEYTSQHVNGNIFTLNGGR